MIFIIILLTVTNLLTLWMYVRFRFLDKRISANQALLTQYLQVHDQLQKTGSAVLEIRKVDTENLMIWRAQ